MKKQSPIVQPHQAFNHQQFDTLLKIINKSRVFLNLLEEIGNHTPEYKQKIDDFLDNMADDKSGISLKDKLKNYYTLNLLIPQLLDLGGYIKIQEHVEQWYPYFKNSSATKANRISFLNHMYKQGFDVISWIEKFEDLKMYKNFINKDPSRANEKFIHKLLLNFKHVYSHDKYVFDEFFGLLKQFPKTDKTAQLIYNIYNNLQHSSTVSYFINKELNSYPLETLRKIGVPENLINLEQEPLAKIECKDTHRTVFSISESYFEDKFKKLHTSFHIKNVVQENIIKTFLEKNPQYKEKYEYGGFNHENAQDNLECALALKEIVNTTDLTPLISKVKEYRKSLDVTYLKNDHRNECLTIIKNYLKNNSLYKNEPLETIMAHIQNNDKYSVYLELNLSYIHDKTGGSLSSTPKLRKMWVEILTTFVKDKINEKFKVMGGLGYESGRINYEFSEKEMQQNVANQLGQYKEFLCSSIVENGLEQYSTKEELNKCLNYLYLNYKIETEHRPERDMKQSPKRKI